jgi:hypothetical protein
LLLGEPGSVEQALVDDLEQLAQAGAPFSATLAATALALARSLDADPDRRAATAKELRATLDKLAEGATSDDVGPDFSGLSTPEHGSV